MSENMYVYILTNQTCSTFYTGVTNNLERRILEHRQKVDPNSFSARYNLTKLVYYETDGDPEHSILREKQIKDYRREKKIILIEEQNPYWKDLSENWYN
jgi:putative endonuclease